MSTKRVWKTNPGKSKAPKKPDAKIYLRFRQIDPMTKQPYETEERVRAGNYIWLHRDLPFDIMEATNDDP